LLAPPPPPPPKREREREREREFITNAKFIWSHNFQKCFTIVLEFFFSILNFMHVEMSKGLGLMDEP